MPTAINRPGGGFHTTDEAAAYYTEQRRRNPDFQAPAGYEWKGDHYERDNQSAFDDVAKWLGRVAAYGSAGYGGAAMAGLAPVAGAAGASGAGAAGASIPVTAGLGSGASVPGSVSLGSLGLGGGASAAGGLAGTLNTIRQVAPIANAGIGMLSALRGGQQDVPYANELSGLLRLQQQRMQQASPLYEAVLRMAMGLLPMSARAGFTAPPGGTGGGGRGTGGA